MISRSLIYYVAVFLEGLGIRLGLGFDTVGVLLDIGLLKSEEASRKESFVEDLAPTFNDLSTSEANTSILPSEAFI